MRELKDGARQWTASDAELTLWSPVDGKVMSVGTLSEDGMLEGVKDRRYGIVEFLEQTMEAEKGHRVFQIVLYLAPQDYHGFHSPCEMSVDTRRHFPGHLLPVAPWLVRRKSDLFAVNERVVLSGVWPGGLMAYVPVGATNVGSILLEHDQDFHSNLTADQLPLWRFSSREYSTPVDFSAGSRVGFFSMGSTVVLVFTAPEDFEFHVAAGDNVQLGMIIGSKQ